MESGFEGTVTNSRYKRRFFFALHVIWPLCDLWVWCWPLGLAYTDNIYYTCIPPSPTHTSGFIKLDSRLVAASFILLYLSMVAPHNGATVKNEKGKMKIFCEYKWTQKYINITLDATKKIIQFQNPVHTHAQIQLLSRLWTLHAMLYHIKLVNIQVQTATTVHVYLIHLMSINRTHWQKCMFTDKKFSQG